MTKPKKSEPNPIEEAIGERAKTTKDVPKIVDKAEFQKLAEIPDEPSPSEMLTLEELNRQTEERLQEKYPEIPIITTPKSSIPVSKPDLQPATETSSPASPVEKSEPAQTFPPQALKNIQPVEDIELTALRKYILEDGFVLATVSFHIASLCAEPLTTPSTTTWDFKDRAMIPDMVLALLNQPGYLEGIFPSLKIIMGSNIGNTAWCAGISTTLAFFDVIRTLPTIKELQKDV